MHSLSSVRVGNLRSAAVGTAAGGGNLLAAGGYAMKDQSGDDSAAQEEAEEQQTIGSFSTSTCSHVFTLMILIGHLRSADVDAPAQKTAPGTMSSTQQKEPSPSVKPLNHSINSAVSVRPFNVIKVDSEFVLSPVCAVEYLITGTVNFPVFNEKEL